MASALVAGATLALTACGGVLGGKGVNAALAADLAKVGCAITVAADEDANYTAATGLTKGAFKGNRADDLSNAARRHAIIGSRLAEIATAETSLAKLKPSSVREKALTSAAKANLADMRALLTFDRAHSPYDTSGNLPDGSGGQFDAAVQELRPEEQAALRPCTKPPDLLRRTATYNP